MKVLLFHTNNDNSILKSLVRDIKKTVPEKDLEICHDFSEMSGFVKSIHKRFGIIILVVRNRLELEGLLTIRQQLQYQHLIFALPDDNPNTVLKAQVLYPRFVGYLDSSYHNITAVLQKMIEKTD